MLRISKGFRNVFVIYLLVVVSVLILLSPVILMIWTSLKPDIIMLKFPPILIFEPTFSHYTKVLFDSYFFVWMRNSIIISTSATLITMIVTVFGGYSLCRFNFRGRDFIALSVLFTYLFPPILLVIPLYITMHYLGLTNTLFSVMLAYLSFTIPFSLWFLRSYFTTIPSDLDDQAMVDGCSRTNAFRYAVLPVAAPGIAAASLLAFSNSYMEYLFAFVMINSVDKYTLTIGLSQYSWMAFMGGGASWGEIMAASVLGAIPVVLIFLFLQKYLIAGLAAGAIKG